MKGKEKEEILRFAQNDRENNQNDKKITRMTKK